MLNQDVLDAFRERVEISPEDNPGRELAKMLLKVLGYTALVLGLGVYLILWFVFHVVTAAWRDPRG